MSSRRRLLPWVLTLAVTLVAGCLAASAPSRALALTEVELAGQTRYETAVEISKEGWPLGSRAVIIATGENWPDALGGAVLTGPQMENGPILLVRQDSIPNAVWNEIDRLNPNRAIILGGSVAVGTDVEARLVTKLGVANVLRLGGATRFDTANRIAAYAIDLDNSDGAPFKGWVFAATGLDFPDALAGAPVAAYAIKPIFLVDPRRAEAGVPVAFMKSKGVQGVYILGGPNAVTNEQYEHLYFEFGTRVSRWAGQDRYQTAARVAEEESSLQGMSFYNISIATGEQYPDALAGGPFAGSMGSLVLLTPQAQLHSAPWATIYDHRFEINRVHYLGGTAAVSERVRGEVRSLLP
jgi:putative cell wall-binding protein